ncbi:hypothetical protein G352_23961 [Rhodococcus ruber BKS 20-38]|uniref:Uncharacterized protein n=1 Tax=Rhodococcus ruber BKS 20-38 TaxID=1278076 RepID=M2XX19_9NOCA|nr:hypothetical protein [Rhodococcus ruber]EME53750.1 hypothetical protein G352_23961 [Rhodococcus ruber BKS 20-38]
MDTEDIQKLMGAALRKRAAQGGRHLHHRDCVHNLPPEEQIAIRGKNVEWRMAMVGSMPEQITPDQWETEPLSG